MHSLLSDRFLKKFAGKRKSRQMPGAMKTKGQEPETDADMIGKLGASEKGSAPAKEANTVVERAGPDESTQPTNQTPTETARGHETTQNDEACP